MATWDGSVESDGEENDAFMKPSPSQLQLTPKPPEEICPDTEENVMEQTEDLFRNFVYQRYRTENIRCTYDNTPVDPELLNFPRIPDTPAAEIGRQLARIGDDINEKYKDTFDRMIDTMSIGPDTAYEAFAGVARKIFAQEINWGRILTLLCFGYRIAVQVLKDHAHRFAEFLGRITQYVLKFLISERIAKWIADHGGWRAALTFIPGVDNRVFLTIVSLAAVSVMAVVVYHRCTM